MNYYKHWPIYENMPEGWDIDKSAGSPLHGHEFITNGKSVLNGQKRALVRVIKNCLQPVNSLPIKRDQPKQEPKIVQEIDSKYRRTVNNLARAKFKQAMLNDILVDLIVCDMESWSKIEYLNELKTLINELGKREKIYTQTELFQD